MGVEGVEGIVVKGVEIERVVVEGVEIGGVEIEKEIGLGVEIGIKRS